MVGFSPVDDAGCFNDTEALGAAETIAGATTWGGAAATGLAGGGTSGGDGGIAGAAETGVALGSAGAFADPRNKRPNMLNIQLCLEIGD